MGSGAEPGGFSLTPHTHTHTPIFPRYFRAALCRRSRGHPRVPPCPAGAGVTSRLTSEPPREKQPMAFGLRVPKCDVSKASGAVAINALPGRGQPAGGNLRDTQRQLRSEKNTPKKGGKGAVQTMGASMEARGSACADPAQVIGPCALL